MTTLPKGNFHLKVCQSQIFMQNPTFRVEFRYEAVLVRARFDAHKNEKDARVVAALIAAGEQECWDKQAYDKFIYADDEGGITEGRQAPHFDQMLDYWHPWERVSLFLVKRFFKRSRFATSATSSNGFPQSEF